MPVEDAEKHQVFFVAVVLSKDGYRADMVYLPEGSPSLFSR
jgi:hypothetical protein